MVGVGSVPPPPPPSFEAGVVVAVVVAAVVAAVVATVVAAGVLSVRVAAVAAVVTVTASPVWLPGSWPWSCCYGTRSGLVMRMVSVRLDAGVAHWGDESSPEKATASSCA
jgi:hypothetical protein